MVNIAQAHLYNLYSYVQAAYQDPWSYAPHSNIYHNSQNRKLINQN